MKRLLVTIILFAEFLSYSQDYSIKSDSVVDIITASFIKSSKGQYEEALNQQHFALEWAKSNNNDSIIGDAYNCIGATYNNMENYDKAEFYYKKSLIHLKKANYQSYIVIYYNNMANLYEAKGDLQKSRQQYELSRNLAIELNSKHFAHWPTYNMAMLDLEAGNHDAAIPLFEEAIESFKPNSEHQPSNRVNAFNALGEIYKKKGEYRLALSKLKIADSLAKGIEGFNTLIKTEEIRYEIYKSTKNEAAVEEALLKRIAYLNSSLSYEKETLKDKSKLEQKLLEKEKTIELNETLYATQQSTLKKTRAFTFIVLFLFIGICLTAFLLYRSTLVREKLNTNLTQKNKQLLEANEKTEYASALKANFFSTISHELRTPLYAVTGITDILIEDDPKKEQKKHLKNLKTSGEYLLSLINNVLQINKFDADKMEVNNVEFNLRSMISNIKETLSYLKKENNNDIQVEIDSTIPELLKGDSLKLKQVIVNLLNNALKFTYDGNVWLTVERLKTVNGDIDLKISVKDDGIGISEEIQSRIFDDFSQKSIRLDRNYEGIGLGLAIVKRLLNAIGSEIKVDSTVDNGATFYFNITLKESDNHAMDDDELFEKIKSLDNRSILVVDDNSVNLMITKRVLENKNIVVTTVNNGFDAIKKVQEEVFDVILMDIHMPKMDGYETTEKIRAFNKTLPIVALTAVKIDENKDRIINSGMDGIIVKPFRLESFFAEINRVIYPTNQ